VAGRVLGRKNGVMAELLAVSILREGAEGQITLLAEGGGKGDQMGLSS
jgi:hypothetical protein